MSDTDREIDIYRPRQTEKEADTLRRRRIFISPKAEAITIQTQRRVFRRANDHHAQRILKIIFLEFFDHAGHP